MNVISNIFHPRLNPSPLLCLDISSGLPVVSSLVCVELSLRELDLLSGLEGGHTEVGAARASERVAKVTLQKHIGILRVH